MGPPPPMATQSVKPTHDVSQNYNSRPNFTEVKNNFIDTRPNFQDPNYSRQTRPNLNESRPMNNKTNGRVEMKGPSDISEILSGFKTKNINIQPTFQKESDNMSTISMNDIKDLDDPVNLPKKSRRRKTSSNAVSLDI
jgi:hypothetical protein